MRIHYGVGRKRRRDDAGGVDTGKRTATQVVTAIGRHAQALYTLATSGSRRDDRREERQGYNLLIFSQTSMCRWDPHAHIWQAGDRDMSLLHPNIGRFYDTKGRCDPDPNPGRKPHPQP